MHALPLAAADFGDWLKLIVGVGAILFYIINHLINESTQSRKRQQQQRKAAASSQRSGEPPVAAQPNARDEIQEFLRRAAQQRKETTARKEPPRTAAGQRRPGTLRERSPVARPTQPPPQTRPPARRYAEPMTEAVEIEVIEDGRSVGSLAEQASRKFSAEDKKFSTEELTSRAARLTDEIARADTERELHLRKMFGHQVGKLPTERSEVTGNQPAAAAVPPEAAAGTLGGLLQGGNLRYAVLLNEILSRPEHRW